MTLRIVKAVRTCTACPSQWDAWTDDGTYLYLRFRHGCGTVSTVLGGTLPASDSLVAEFVTSTADGLLELEEFCQFAGIDLASDADVSNARLGYVSPDGER